MEKVLLPRGLVLNAVALKESFGNKHVIFINMFLLFINLLLQNAITGPGVIKLFPCSTQLSMKFILLINVQMPTIVGI